MSKLWPCRCLTVILAIAIASTVQARPAGTALPGPKGPWRLGTWALWRRPGNCQPDLRDEDAGPDHHRRSHDRHLPEDPRRTPRPYSAARSYADLHRLRGQDPGGRAPPLAWRCLLYTS